MLSRLKLNTVIIAVFIIGLLAGCGAGTVSPGTEDGFADTFWEDSVEGYFSVRQTLSGGQAISDVELRELSVSSDENEVCITLSFARGGDQLLLPDNTSQLVPEFKITCHDGLRRLELRMNGLSLNSAAFKQGMFEETCILGAVSCSSVGADNAALYFNISSNFVYRAAVTQNRLAIYILPIEERPKESWYRPKLRFSSFCFPAQASIF